ncbi:4-(cytidine 5'-diphospho)-2-C-methyl-D-erythritol kinase [Rhodoferax koreense]|uniref:4-diphosphocytidyl-2-C-methyl-D-erythritol kinase n=1 Tax=Rhodoferax koreensis TaxID=1842727 RepID=A0A1P8K4A0_9BURK|nr:4-(cytidine 5'-diphospho)-2-C-methyl-D-erythritol kinase [Rhodoferax koreense]APW40840.1 4-(cytidine 5'-diphospho)-2-C-methyl-D-erythritol kinase [Rhodoferax koreense]
MKAIYDVPAPAKLNLFLHITGRRADGYHLLQSAFMLIDWCDTLHFELRSDGRLSRQDLTTPLPADDLVLRAARLLQAAGRTSLGADIGIEKRVPAQAGMGGGSSDAASTLLALNRLWGLDMPLSRLETLGLQLGADVPFFLRGRNAWVEGIGERITPVVLPPGKFLVVKPQDGLETRTIFSDDGLKRDSASAIITGFAAHPYHFGENDLQPVAERLCPALSQALIWLAGKGLKGRMTGSGSAVFAHMSTGDAGEADDIDVSDADSRWQVRKCSNMAAHPLLGWATSDG